MVHSGTLRWKLTDHQKCLITLIFTIWNNEIILIHSSFWRNKTFNLWFGLHIHPSKWLHTPSAGQSVVVYLSGQMVGALVQVWCSPCVSGLARGGLTLLTRHPDCPEHTGQCHSHYCTLGNTPTPAPAQYLADRYGASQLRITFIKSNYLSLHRTVPLSSAFVL